jgi:hypothetical protein
MTALFSWKARPPKPKRQEGQSRVVRRLLLLPKKLGDEWRWLGVELIYQVCMKRYVPFRSIPGGYVTLVFVDSRWAV